jgi:hypothetical protein
MQFNDKGIFHPAVSSVHDQRKACGVPEWLNAGLEKMGSF